MESNLNQSKNVIFRFRFKIDTIKPETLRENSFHLYPNLKICNQMMNSILSSLELSELLIKPSESIILKIINNGISLSQLAAAKATGDLLRFRTLPIERYFVFRTRI